MTAYYNEIDPYAAQWLRNLIDAGHIAPGDVDERSIVDVSADDLRGYTQAHFFAGIGGWSVALRLAGWPDDRPVWTGSCPCQPFSAAGAGKAGDDERHLWPAWFSLISECRPSIVYGEQVEAAIGWGWLDVVYADLEAEGYACGASILPACSVGAPHIRNRLWFVADADGGHTGTEGLQRGGEHGQRTQDDRVGELGHAWSEGRKGRIGPGNMELHRGTQPIRPTSPTGLFSGMADSERNGRRADEPKRRSQGRIADGWAGAEFIQCTDGKARPIEPGSFPLAHGVQRRTSKLRAYGNAIVPQVAAEFVMSTLAVSSQHRGTE